MNAAMERRQRIRPSVAAGVRAGFEGRTRRRLGVRIVTRSALPLVRIVGRNEPLDDPAHFVAAKAIALAGNELRERSVRCSRVGNGRGELVTRHAVEARLPGHFSEPDLRLFVTSSLRAGLRDGHEAVRGDAVTCQTLDAQDFGRVGLQMHPVARRRDNTLPRAVGVLLDVTRRAHLARNRSVWTDLPGTEQHPLRDLRHLGDERLVVTIVAAQIRDAMVLALLESLIDLVVQRSGTRDRIDCCFVNRRRTWCRRPPFRGVT
jgi:hypothetical protein